MITTSISARVNPALHKRALKHAPSGDPLTIGIQQTEKQLLQALEKFGVVRFSSVGKPFDPSQHDAIQQLETSEFPAEPRSAML